MSEEKPFRFLTGEEFTKLSPEQRAQYMKRVKEYFDSKRKPGDPSSAKKKPGDK